jgi:hypothetical protein
LSISAEEAYIAKAFDGEWNSEVKTSNVVESSNERKNAEEGSEGSPFDENCRWSRDLKREESNKTGDEVRRMEDVQGEAK